MEEQESKRLESKGTIQIRAAKGEIQGDEDERPNTDERRLGRVLWLSGSKREEETEH